MMLLRPEFHKRDLRIIQGSPNTYFDLRELRVASTRFRIAS
jgi:hypothetical protein